VYSLKGSENISWSSRGRYYYSFTEW